ncbi:MAG: CRISPR system precrRNA processing endoribonuclease RAMP protein Cas6 [Actinomycetota bacterium]
MTFTKGSEVEFAGLSLVLRSVVTSRQAIPLRDWLFEFEHPLVYIPAAQQAGVTKVIVSLQSPEFYSGLMQAVCLRISQNKLVKWQGKVYEVSGVEVDSSSLHVLQIPLYATAQLPNTLGRAIHAQFFHWVATANPGLAQELHQQENFPTTLVLKPGESRYQKFLRVGLLQKSLLAPFLWGLSQDVGGDITLTDVPCRLGEQVAILQASSYESLAELEAQKAITLEFLSPTSFKQGQAVQPFPLPDLVFNNLLRRWNAFAPSELQFPSFEWKGMTSAYELKTHALKMKGGAEIGATGWVRYEFHEEEQAKVATVLAHFALFSGVGRKTAMGMGQVRIANW